MVASSSMSAAGVILAVMISCSTLSLSVTATRPVRDILAITFPESSCSLSTQASAVGRQPAIADLPQTAAVACALHACSGTDSCQMRPIPDLELFTCDEGVTLVSVQDLLQQAVMAQAQDIHSADLEQHDGPDDAQNSDTDLDSTGYFSSSALLTPSVLKFAAECYMTPASAADKTAQESRVPVWSDTHTIEVSAQDWNSTADRSTSDLSIGTASSEWSHTNLEQRVLIVELTLPAARDLPLEDDAASTVDLQNNSQKAPEAADDVVADGSADGVQLSTCVKSWQVWLARAGMAVVVGALQLAPFLLRKE